jgi:hypothetical protein
MGRMNLIVVGTVVLTSCAMGPQPEVGGVVQELGKCPDWGCGTNSPIIDSQGFHELDLDGVANDEGFVYERFVKGGNEYRLDITDGIIRGYSGSTVIAGGNLVGAQIWVKSPAGSEYAIQINNVDVTSFWALPPSGVPQALQTYVFQWSTTYHGVSKNDWQDLCPDLMEDTLGQNAHSTVVFEGDRIIAKAKTVSQTIDSRWFNFGCAGSALAKLYLTGHVQAARVAGFSNGWDQRQTILKLFSADYCGKGTPFTVGGTPLLWADRPATMNITDKAKVEARWTKDGAYCLTKPRIAANGTPLGLKTFPDIEASISAECTLPVCQNDSLDPGSDYLVSANPVLP